MSTELMPEPASLILNAIEPAEAVPDLLAGLVEQPATDPGAAFMPEAFNPSGAA